MALNAGIILSGQQFDLAGAMQNGLALAQNQNALNRQREIEQLYRTQGNALMQGDTNALGQLAQYDPAAALGIKSTIQSNAYATEDQNFQRETARREAERYVKEVGAEKAAALAAQTEADVRRALAAPDPATFDAMMVEMGMPEMAGQWANRQQLAIPYLEFADALKVISPAAPKDPAAEQKIQRLMETGLDRETAIGIVDGRLEVSRDPITGAVVVVDVAKAPRVGQAPVITPAETVATPANDPAKLDFGPQYPDAASSFGLEGAVRKFANNAADVVGASPIFPDTMAAQNDFAVLKEKLINDIASAYDRQPPSWLLKNIEALTPQAGSVFTGPEEAQSKLKSIGRDLQRELAALDAQAGTPMSPTRQQEMEAKRAGLVAGLSRVTEALNAFSGPALRPEVESRLDKYK